MKFIVDSMFPREVCEYLRELGHEAVSPIDLGGHNMPDNDLIQTASEQEMVVVTENARDFVAVSSCSVLLIRKSWWPIGALTTRLVAAIDRWATVNPRPGHWAQWLEAEFR